MAIRRKSIPPGLGSKWVQRLPNCVLNQIAPRSRTRRSTRSHTFRRTQSTYGILRFSHRLAVCNTILPDICTHVRHTRKLSRIINDDLKRTGSTIDRYSHLWTFLRPRTGRRKVVTLPVSAQKLRGP